jgi:hypothetical protein
MARVKEEQERLFLEKNITLKHFDKCWTKLAAGEIAIQDSIAELEAILVRFRGPCLPAVARAFFSGMASRSPSSTGLQAGGC